MNRRSFFKLAGGAAAVAIAAPVLQQVAPFIRVKASHRSGSAQHCPSHRATVDSR
jgi:hypothetical protein